MAARRTSGIIRCTKGAILSLPLIILLRVTALPFSAHGFSLRQQPTARTTPGLLPRRIHRGNERGTRSGSVLLLNGERPDGGGDPPNSFDAATSFRRFTDPVIDDPGLPFTDALVAQIIAPSLQIAWLSAFHAPRPSWLQPIVSVDLLYSPVGSLVAPTLLHGAALASCWLAGALAARAYERASISPVRRRPQQTNVDEDDDDPSQWDYRPVGQAVLRAGAFATGLLMLATQMDLWFEFQGRWIQLGESEETDFRLLVAAVELINDVVFEAVTLAAWRLLLAYQTERLSSNDDTYY